MHLVDNKEHKPETDFVTTGMTVSLNLSLKQAAALDHSAVSVT